MSSWVLQINQWLLDQRAASPEELPALPSVADGGSRAILQQAAEASAAAAEPPATIKGSAKTPGKMMQASSTPAKKNKDTGNPACIHHQYMNRIKFTYPGYMARCAWSAAQHWLSAEKQSVCIEPATLSRRHRRQSRLLQGSRRRWWTTCPG